MDINSQNWVVLNNLPAQQSDSYQFIQSVEIKGEAGILAVSTQALPPIEHDSAYYLQNQRSQKGAKFAIKASREAFETLQEQQLDFDRDYLSLLIKYWNYNISLHFIANPLSKTKENSQHKNNTLSNNSPSALLNLTSLYDTTINVILITDKQLQIYQIADSQLLLLNKKHIIETNTAKPKRYLSFPQYLAHPDLIATYACQSIDIADYKLEMLVLDTQPNHATSLLQLQGAIYQLARQLDTQGVDYVKNRQDPATNQIIIKRNRFGYNSVTHALNRESYHLHQKVDLQSRQIDQLESEIYQLSLSQQKLQPHKEEPIVALKPNSDALPKQRKKAFSIGTAVIAVSTFALVTTSTITYSLWQNSHSNNIRIAQSHSGTVSPNQPPSRNTALIETVEKYKETISPISKPLEVEYDNHLEATFKSAISRQNKTDVNVFTNYQTPKSADTAPRNDGRNQIANTEVSQNKLTTLIVEHPQQHKQNDLQLTKKRQVAANLSPIKVAKKIDPVDLIITGMKNNKVKAPPPSPQQKKAAVVIAKVSKQRKRVLVSKLKPRSQPRTLHHNVVNKPKKVAIKKPVQTKPRQPAKATKYTHIAKAQPMQKRHHKPVRRPISKAIQARHNQSTRAKKVSYVAKTRAIRKDHKTLQNKLALAKRDLENTQKQTIIQQIIANSTAFASHTLRLKKKHKEIGIVNELFMATKSHHYAKQKQLLERRQVQLNQKMHHLSLQYSQQLKRLCRYAPPYSSKLSTQATPLERIALSHLKQQLRNCSKPKNISAKFIDKMLRHNYQKLASR